MCYGRLSSDRNPVLHLWEILERRLRRRFPPTSTKQQIMEFLVDKWCRIPPTEFQTQVESMPRCIEAVPVARGPIKTPYVGVSFILSVTFRSHREKKVGISEERKPNIILY